MRPQKIEISHKTIIFTVLFILSLGLVWYLRGLLATIFICFIFMGALNPSVTRLEKLKIPRPLAILLLYIVIVAVVAFAISGVVPVLVEQTNSLITVLPAYLQHTTFFGMPAIDFSSQLQILQSLPANIARFTISVFSNLFSAFVILVITFYLLIERKNFDKYSFSVFGHDGQHKFQEIIDQVENSLGRWVSAEMVLMTVIGVLTYIGYLALGLNFAVPLAIIAGLLEVVPNIGPTISAVLAALVGVTVSPLTGLMTIIWAIVVQQLENNFIVPKIMKETVGLNPLITIIAIAAGAKLAGVMGAVLAIPVFLTGQIVFRVLTKQDKAKE